MVNRPVLTRSDLKVTGKPTAKKKAGVADSWRSRIVGEGEVRAADLVANPLNWRMHPKDQLAALKGVLSSVGWVQRVIVNRVTGHIVDGHARVQLASRQDETVPVLYVELDAEEERIVLATLDPLSAMADPDSTILATLLHDLHTDNDNLRDLLDSLQKTSGVIVDDVDPESRPEAFSGYDEDIEPQFICPQCAYEWRGTAHSTKTSGRGRSSAHG